MAVRSSIMTLLALLLWTSQWNEASSQSKNAMQFETLTPWIIAAESKSKELSQERQELLLKAASAISDSLTKHGKAELLFVCTHNSRRSHLGQVWASVAAEQYGVKNVQSYSCGTESTECNIRTVKSLRRSGLSVVQQSLKKNPIYLLQFSEGREPIGLFSKAFGDATLPTKNLIAMMCCDDADQKCPIVPGAEARFALHYQDPKSQDGTPNEAAAYDERSMQIASEMLFVFRNVATKVAK